MCGIFGFAGFDEPGLLRRMADAIRHRGPDGEGFFANEPDNDGPSDKFSMGMRRLSIIDLNTGDQPIFNEDRTVAVILNGEIYNYPELTAELRAAGHVFATGSDTEVLVHGYEQWGHDVVQHLNGMFAFCIYDINAGEVFIARDRAGQKPLYYYYENGRLLFASEVKALLASSHVSAACNLAAIDGYLGLRYAPQPETMFQDVHVLPAAHTMTLRRGELTIQRYWDVTVNQGPYGSHDEYLAAFDDIFVDAVRLTLRSDVPVAAYLSAGVDSSLVVGTMSKFINNFKTFSLGFGSPIDELPDARRLAAVFGTEHHEVVMQTQDLGRLAKVIYHLERPIGDALVLAYDRLAEAASGHVKVVLSGEGADELFAGYSFQKVIRYTALWDRLVPGFLQRGVALPALQAIPVSALNQLFNYPAYLGNSGKQRVVEYLRGFRGRSLAHNYAYLRTLWEQDDRRQLYAPAHKGLVTDAWLKQSRDTNGAILDRLLKLQFDDWLQDNLLLRQDKNTMAHSLELRAPFLDHRLIELAFRMPPGLKVHRLTDKYIEREYARRTLPADAANRPKNPFYFPLEEFYQDPASKELVAMTLNEDAVNKRGYFDYNYIKHLKEKVESREFVYIKQLYSLVILELWHMVFIDNQKLW